MTRVEVVKIHGVPQNMCRRTDAAFYCIRVSMQITHFTGIIKRYESRRVFNAIWKRRGKAHLNDTRWVRFWKFLRYFKRRAETCRSRSFDIRRVLLGGVNKKKRGEFLACKVGSFYKRVKRACLGGMLYYSFNQTIRLWPRKSIGATKRLPTRRSDAVQLEVRGMQ